MCSVRKVPKPNQDRVGANLHPAKTGRAALSLMIFIISTVRTSHSPLYNS